MTKKNRSHKNFGFLYYLPQPLLCFRLLTVHIMVEMRRIELLSEIHPHHKALSQ